MTNLASAAATMETIGAEKCGGRITAFEVEFLAPNGAALEATAKALVRGAATKLRNFEELSIVVARPSGRLTAAGDRHLGITRECHERVADTGSGKAFWNGAHRASVCSVGAGNSDALAAVEKRVDAPNEMPELLVELSDGTLRGLGLSRGDVASTPSRKRLHPSEATPRAADKVFFARGFR